MNTLSTILKELSADYQLVYKANPGNAGDGVIAAATYDFLDNNDISYNHFSPHSQYNAEKDVLIFGGGGNLIESYYREGADFILNNYQRFNKVIVLPSTIRGYTELLQLIKHKTIICCRETNSFYHMLNAGYSVDKNLLLIDDMAFHLNLNRYLANIAPIRDVVNCFRTDSESAINNQPEDNHDISLTWNGDYWNNTFLARNSTSCFINFLEETNEINTDRLHIAIVGSLMGKKVNFYPNAYYKNEAVYKYSLLNKYPKTFFIKSY